MRIGFLLILIFGLSNCSFDKNSQFWTEDNKLTNKNNKVLIKKIKQKSSNLLSLTEEEFKIYLEDYVKESKYPDISK